MSNLKTAFQREQTRVLSKGLEEPRRFLQVVTGSRQVGKTTLVHQVTQGQSLPLFGPDTLLHQNARPATRRRQHGHAGALSQAPRRRRTLDRASEVAGETVRQRASSPKLQVLNTALLSVMEGLSPEESRKDRSFYGRQVESAVGAHLANAARAEGLELLYWRDRNREVDFVVRRNRKLTAIEVKSGLRRDCLPGMSAFVDTYQPARCLLIGGDGIPLEDFLRKPATHWLETKNGGR